MDRALRAAGGDPVFNLALEESFLRGSQVRGSLLLLYVDDPCVVVGRNQNPWVEAAPGSLLPVLRRVSGGGAGLPRRGNLNWSLIVPRSSHDPEARSSASSLSPCGSSGVETVSGPRGGLFVAQGPLEGLKALRDRAAGSRPTRDAPRDPPRGRRPRGTLIQPRRHRRQRARPPFAPSSSPSVNLSTLCPGLGVEEVAAPRSRAPSAAAPRGGRAPRGRALPRRGGSAARELGVDLGRHSDLLARPAMGRR